MDAMESGFQGVVTPWIRVSWRGQGGSGLQAWRKLASARIAGLLVTVPAVRGPGRHRAGNLSSHASPGEGGPGQGRA